MYCSVYLSPANRQAASNTEHIQAEKWPNNNTAANDRHTRPGVGEVGRVRSTPSGRHTSGRHTPQLSRSVQNLAPSSAPSQTSTHTFLPPYLSVLDLNPWLSRVGWVESMMTLAAVWRSLTHTHMRQTLGGGDLVCFGNLTCGLVKVMGWVSML